MMICDENTIAMEEARKKFIDFIDKEKYYEMPLQDQVLLPSATDEAKKAFEIYKEKALIVNKMAFLGE